MQRKPRPGAVVPVGLIAAEEAGIRHALAGWLARRPGCFDAETSLGFFEDFFLRKLQTNDEKLDAAMIVDIAERGHPPADAAVRKFIRQAIEKDQFQSLPVSVRNFNRKAIERAPLTGYLSRSPQVVDTFLRDCHIVLLIKCVKINWPAVPLLYSSSRASAAKMVGAVFGLSEQQARRIYKADKGQSRRFALFMSSSLSNGPLPNER